MLDFDAWLGDAEPFEFRLDGKDYTVSAPRFDEALRALAVVGAVAKEYTESDALAQNVNANWMADGLLSQMRFEGWLPDCYYRWRLRRSFKKLSNIEKIVTVDRLADFFSASLRNRLMTVTARTMRASENS